MFGMFERERLRQCGDCWIANYYEWLIKQEKAAHKEPTADTEAERVAKLPPCGTTKKCPACGSASLQRNMGKDTAPHAAHWSLDVWCIECGYRAAEERPLFNRGLSGKDK